MAQTSVTQPISRLNPPVHSQNLSDDCTCRNCAHWREEYAVLVPTCAPAYKVAPCEAAGSKDHTMPEGDLNGTGWVLTDAQAWCAGFVPSQEYLDAQAM